MAFSQNLRYVKDAAHVSNYKLAKDLGCSQTAIANWLDRGTVPHQKTRQRIADYFGITLEALDGDALPVLPPKGAKKEPPSDNDAEQLKAALDRILGKLSRENQLLLYEYAIRLDERNPKDDG